MSVSAKNRLEPAAAPLTAIGAVDIGGTKIAAGVVDRSGQVLASREWPSTDYPDPQDGRDHIARMLGEAALQAGVRLCGAGIGLTGRVSPDRGVIGSNAFLPGWEGYPLAQALGEALDLPTAIENDADAAALGEWAWGAGRGRRTFLLVTIGTGIGAGLLIEGKLYRGVDAAHPEMGHHVIDPSGPACFCGAHGCWESLASGSAMLRWAQARFPAAGWQDTRQICQAAEGGDTQALACLRRTARYLGVGLANMVTLFAPEAIALGGGLMGSRHLFWDNMLQTVRDHCGLVPHERVQVLPASLGPQTGLAGAAQVWISCYEPGLMP